MLYIPLSRALLVLLAVGAVEVDKPAPSSPHSLRAHTESFTMSADFEAPAKFSWVVPNKLAGCAFPEKKENLQYLVSAGVSLLISLTAEKEVDRQGVPESQLDIRRVPVVDFTPPTLEQMVEFARMTNAHIAQGKAVCAHCAWGKGRTGTMLAVYFVSTGLSASDAIKKIRELREGSVETAEQEAAVREFEKFRQEKKG